MGQITAAKAACFDSKCRPWGVSALSTFDKMHPFVESAKKPAAKTLVNSPCGACTVIPYTPPMIIRSVTHRGLLRLIENDDSRELRPDLVRRVRNVLAALIVAADM